MLLYSYKFVIIKAAYDLHDGQVFLPPQMLLDLWSHGGQHIVHVHDDMNERIDQSQ